MRVNWRDHQQLNIPVICFGYSLSSGQYCCTTCNVKFPFKSKLERHLQSDDHKMFTDSLQAMPVDYDNLYVDAHPQEVCRLYA